MAYRLIPNPEFADIASYIQNFAVDYAGWTSAGSNRITTEHSEAGISFELASVNGAARYGQRVEVRLMSGSTMLRSAHITTPYIARAWLPPSKLHMFGSSEPVPYIAAVVEYGDGFFRHLYFGHIHKFGDYEGGEVLSGSRHYVNNSNTNYRDGGNMYLFGGMNSATDASESGGVRIIHPDVGGELIAPFRSGVSKQVTSIMPAGFVMGGFGDTYNDQQIARGQNTLAGVQVFTPINLYLSRGSSRFTPIGVPPGVRLVNMTNIGADTAITAGGKNWRCYPQFRRGETENGSSPQPGDNMLNETSYIVGYAYLEE